jgi:hypothetical protein
MQMDLSGVGNLQMAYAPADFPEPDLIDNKNQVSITTAVSNLTLHYISDTVEKQQQSRAWRRKVRDIIQNHQEQILQFFISPMRSDHPLQIARQILTKYGKLYPSYDTSRPVPTLLKDYLVDISSNGLDSLNQYIDGLMRTREKDTAVLRWTSMSKQLLDHMRDVGDELIRIDQKLKNECSHLDTVIEKVTTIVNLPNPGIDGFEEIMVKYIEKQFQKHLLQITL